MCLQSVPPYQWSSTSSFAATLNSLSTGPHVSQGLPGRCLVASKRLLLICS